MENVRRQIRRGNGGFLCRILLVTKSFAIVGCGENEAVIFLGLTPGKVIVAGRDCPEFSDQKARLPEQGDEVIAYVEDLEGQYVVMAWGYYDQLVEAEETIKAGSQGQNGASHHVPKHMEKRQPRRSPPPIAAVAAAS